MIRSFVLLALLIFTSEVIAKKLEFSELEVAQTYYSSTRLRVRNSSDEVVFTLRENDEIQIIDLSGYKENYVEVSIVSERFERLDITESIYVHYGYLTSEKNLEMEVVKDVKNGGHFVIQNIATEKLRVYQKQCDEVTNVCRHKMVMESDMAVGEDDSKTWTILGYFKITEWWKFYQDGAANYPSWYRRGFPMPPKAGSSVMKWTKSKYMPKRGGNVRGAFGWYTAKLGPDPRAQWTHGTIGWGSDKNKYIEATREFWNNFFTDPRSSGCSRLNNEAIAYLRELVPVGSPIIKIYAKEAYLDKDLTGYSGKKFYWKYILTKENAYKKYNYSSDAKKVRAREVRSSQVLERGTYRVDRLPTVYKFYDGKDLSKYEAREKQRGNIYRVPRKKMRGVFYVDAGLIKNYSHPRYYKIKKGGVRGVVGPDWIMYKKEKQLALEN